MNKTERINQLLKTFELFEATFSGESYKAGVLIGILLDLASESDILFETIDKKLRGYVLWHQLSYQELEEDQTQTQMQAQVKV